MLIRNLGLLFVLGTGVTAAAAAPKKSADAKSCQAPVQKLIRQTAANMGLTQQFGLQLTEREPHGDVVEFASGAFITDDGYISNASAVVTVRVTNGVCKPIKLDIVVGE